MQSPISTDYHHPYSNRSLSTAWYQTDVEKSKWNSRGWTFQEGIAFRRSIMFSNRLYYRCQQSLKAEYTDVDLSTVLRSTSVYQPSLYESLSSPHPEGSEYQFWYKFVTNYMRRNLTYPEDLFPAISGIAHQIANSRGDQYYAGLWESDLITGLLWRQDNYTSSDSLYRTQRTYVAPSWSWASCGNFRKTVIWADYPKNLKYTNSVRNSKIEDIQTTSIRLNTMGRISSGYLVVSGTSKWITAAQLKFQSLGNRCDFYPDELFTIVQPTEKLCMISLRKVSGHPRWSHMVQGLVCQKSNDTNDFTRVGLFHIKSRRNMIQEFSWPECLEEKTFRIV
jgi:hypothetical protein